MNDADIKPLVDGFLSESLAASKNEIFALKAKAEGNAQSERLFTALAMAQRVHAKKCLMLLRGKAETTVENLAEMLSILDMIKGQYEASLDSLAQAEHQGSENTADEGAAASFLEQFKKTAVNHRGLITQMDENKPAPYHVCTVCGFIFTGEVKGRCPVCQAVESKFEAVD